MIKGFTAKEVMAIAEWMEDHDVREVEFKVGLDEKYVFTDDRTFYNIKEILKDY